MQAWCVRSVARSVQPGSISRLAMARAFACPLLLPARHRVVVVALRRASGIVLEALGFPECFRSDRGLAHGRAFRRRQAHFRIGLQVGACFLVDRAGIVVV